MLALLLACCAAGCATTGSAEAEQKPAPPQRVFSRDLDAPARPGKPAGTVVAKKDLPSTSHACTQRVPEEEVGVDRARRRLEELSCSSAMWIDGLFGDTYDVDAARAAYGRLELSHFWSEYYGNRTRVRLNVRADFTNLEDGLSGFLGRDDDDAFVRDRTEHFGVRSQFPQIDDNDEWLAGLGYSLPGSESLQSDFRVGVRGLAHMRLFVQNRVGYIPWSDDDNLLYLRATPFWNTVDGFGFTTGVDFSRVLSDTRLVRWANAGTISQDTEGVSWYTALIDYHALSRRRGIAYEAFVRGETGLPVSLVEYGLQASFRHPIISRLFGEWVLGYTWPKVLPEEKREGAIGVGFGIELPFGSHYD
ncbi:MAG TPA: hypothetical protein VLI06_15115 [Solimonas sp.]|nr:hypothetical protein [Solimonas sp.]